MSLPPFTSGLLELKRRVVAFLETNGVSAKVSLGWKERGRQTNQGPGTANRIVIVPSDLNGSAGTLDIIHSPGPRPLLNEQGQRIGSVRGLREWSRTFLFVVWGHGEDEEGTIEATETLFEWAVRAVHHSGYSQIEWGNVLWTVEPTEVSYGREIIAQCTLSHPLFDVPHETARPTSVGVTGEFKKPGDEDEGEDP